jgi:hypothetical protein
LYSHYLCCGSGIRWIFDPWFRDPGWVKIRIGIRDEHPGSYFREQINNFIVKILKFFYVDPGPGPGIFLTLDPGSGLEKSLLGEANQVDRDEKTVFF